MRRNADNHIVVPLGTRRRTEAAERITAVYLSLGVHALLGIGVAFYTLADHRDPTVAVARTVEVLSVREFDPMWPGRQMRRETVEDSRRTAPALDGRTAPPVTSAGTPGPPEPATAAPAGETVAALAPPPEPAPAITALDAAHAPAPPRALTGAAAGPPAAPGVEAPAGIPSVAPSGERALVGFEAPSVGPVRAPAAEARAVVGDAPRTAEPVAADGTRILARSGGIEAAATLEAVATDDAGAARAPKVRGDTLPEAAARHPAAAPAATIEAIAPVEAAAPAAAEAADRARPEEARRADSAAPAHAAAPVAAEAVARQALPSVAEQPAARIAALAGTPRYRAEAPAPAPTTPPAATGPDARLSAVAETPRLNVSAEPAPVPDEAAAERLLAGLIPSVPPDRSDGTAAKIASLLGSVDCGHLSGRLDAATGALVLTGNVPTPGERDRLVDALARLKGVTAVREDGVVVLPRPHCRILDTLRLSGLTPSAAHRDGLAMLADPVGAGVQRFAEGEPIVVRLTTPRFPAFVYADFYDRSGRVYHLLPNARRPDNRFAPGRVVAIGDGNAGMRLRAAPPFGIGVVVAIGSSVRLFDRSRPVAEDAERYLAALAEAAREARAAAAGVEQEYIYVFVVTEPRRAGRAAAEAGAGE